MKVETLDLTPNHCGHVTMLALLVEHSTNADDRTEALAKLREYAMRHAVDLDSEKDHESGRKCYRCGNPK